VRFLLVMLDVGSVPFIMFLTLIESLLNRCAMRCAAASGRLALGATIGSPFQSLPVACSFYSPPSPRSQGRDERSSLLEGWGEEDPRLARSWKLPLTRTFSCA